MDDLMDHGIMQYLILLLAVIAGIVALKTLVNFLPDAPVVKSVKSVILAV